MPWPPAPGTPLLDGVVAAWRASVFAPARFFPLLGRMDGVLPSVLYYLALGLLVAGVGLFWRMVLPIPEPAGPLAELLLMGGRGSPLLDFLLAPLFLLGSLLIASAVVHVLLLVLGGAEGGMGTTVRVFCFAYGPQIFAVVPLVGSVVGGIWAVVLSIVGLRHAHATSGWRAALAVLLPLFVLLAFGILAALLVSLGSVPM